MAVQEGPGVGPSQYQGMGRSIHKVVAHDVSNPSKSPPATSTSQVQVQVQDDTELNVFKREVQAQTARQVAQVLRGGKTKLPDFHGAVACT